MQLHFDRNNYFALQKYVNHYKIQPIKSTSQLKYQLHLQVAILII